MNSRYRSIWKYYSIQDWPHGRWKLSGNFYSVLAERPEKDKNIREPYKAP